MPLYYTTNAVASSCSCDDENYNNNNNNKNLSNQPTCNKKEAWLSYSSRRWCFAACCDINLFVYHVNRSSCDQIYISHYQYISLYYPATRVAVKACNTPISDEQWFVEHTHRASITAFSFSLSFSLPLWLHVENSNLLSLPAGKYISPIPFNYWTLKNAIRRNMQPPSRVESLDVCHAVEQLSCTTVLCRTSTFQCYVLVWKKT